MINIRTAIGVRIDDAIWAAADNLNGIVKVYEGGNVEYICAFPGYDMWEVHLFGKTIYHDGKLFFLPQASNQLAIFHLDTKEVQYIELGISDVKSIHRYADICIWKNSLFLFPKCAKEIIKLDLDNYHIEEVNGPIDFLGNNGFLYNGIAFMEYSISVNQNIATMFCYQGKAIINFDMETLKYDITYIDEMSGNFLCGIKDEEYMYMCGSEQICILNIRNKRLECRIKTKCEKEFFACINMKDDIVFFPFRGEDILILNKKSRESKRVHVDFNEYVLKNNQEVKVISVFQEKDKVIFITRRGSDIFSYDMVENTLVNMKFILSKSGEKKCFSELRTDIKNSKKCIMEEEIDLKAYLYITNKYL